MWGVHPCRKREKQRQDIYLQTWELVQPGSNRGWADYVELLFGDAKRSLWRCGKCQATKEHPQWKLHEDTSHLLHTVPEEGVLKLSYNHKARLQRSFPMDPIRMNSI